MVFIIFGHGYLEVDMENTVIYLTSVGYKILSVVSTIIAIIFTVILMYNYPEIPWYAIAFMCFVSLFCGFACFLCFNHRIIFSPSKAVIKFCVLKTKIIPISEIKEIIVSTAYSINVKKFCSIIIALNDENVLMYSGYEAIIRRNAVLKTKKIIAKINKLLEEYRA